MSGVEAQAVDASHTEMQDSAGGFPSGDYTPFEYLDNPWHTWNLHPSGVLRSLAGVGFGWYYPAGPGGYFSYAQNNMYVLELALGFQIAGRRYRSTEDFQSGQLSSSHHTKNLLTYAFSADEVKVRSAFAQCGENALVAAVELENKSGKPQTVQVMAMQT